MTFAPTCVHSFAADLPDETPTVRACFYDDDGDYIAVLPVVCRRGVWVAVDADGEGVVIHEPSGSSVCTANFDDLDMTPDEAVVLCRMLGDWPDHDTGRCFGHSDVGWSDGPEIDATVERFLAWQRGARVFNPSPTAER